MLNIRRQIIVVLKAWRNWKIKIKLYWSKYKKVDEDNIIPSNFNKQHNNKCKILQKNKQTVNNIIREYIYRSKQLIIIGTNLIAVTY